MRTREILVEARELVRTGWCQGADARDANGAPVEPWHSSARSWSMLGALVAVRGMGRETPTQLPVEELGQAVALLGEAVATHSPEAWNDHAQRKAAEVLAAFDTAIGLHAARKRLRLIDAATATEAGSSVRGSG